ncbi:hypothetical protein CLU79DRAFT_739188 [Phycomyces nitens]|nr:hypothetical protein CLU79DRAFT_739188 [Phycomyces nitens]
MAKLRIADHFWAEDNRALNILSERMQKSNATCNAIRTVFEKRARIEEEYGQRLLNLSEISLSEFEENYSTFSESLESIPTATEAAARAHIDLAQHIKQLLETPLAGFIRNQKDQWKMATVRVSESQDLKSRHLQGMQHAHSNYIDERNRLSRKSSMDYNRKSEVQQSLHTLSNLEQSYKLSVEDLSSASTQWADDWRNTCDIFQRLEENRIDYLRRTIWSYANMMSTVYVVDDQSCERIRTSLEVIDISGDTEAFIEHKGTSTAIPDVPQFVPYDPLSLQTSNTEEGQSRNTHEINIPVADEELRSVNDQLKMLPLASEAMDNKLVNRMTEKDSFIHPNSRLSFKENSNLLGREISQTRSADSNSDMLQNTVISVLPALDKSPTDGLFRESWDRPAFSRKESSGRVRQSKYDTKQVSDLEHTPRSSRGVSTVNLPQRTSSLPKDPLVFSSYATQLAPAESIDNLPDWHAYNDYLSKTPSNLGTTQSQLERKSRSDFSKLVVNTSLEPSHASLNTNNRKRSGLLNPQTDHEHESWKHSRSPSLQSPATLSSNDPIGLASQGQGKEPEPTISIYIFQKV